MASARRRRSAGGSSWNVGAASRTSRTVLRTSGSGSSSGSTRAAGGARPALPVLIIASLPGVGVVAFVERQAGLEPRGGGFDHRIARANEASAAVEPWRYLAEPGKDQHAGFSARDTRRYVGVLLHVALDDRPHSAPDAACAQRLLEGRLFEDRDRLLDRYEQIACGKAGDAAAAGNEVRG